MHRETQSSPEICSSCLHAAAETESCPDRKPSAQAAASRSNPCQWSTTSPAERIPPPPRAESQYSPPQVPEDGSASPAELLSPTPTQPFGSLGSPSGYTSCFTGTSASELKIEPTSGSAMSMEKERKTCARYQQQRTHGHRSIRRQQQAR